MANPKFCPFMRLPLELRQQIWEMAIDPREVVFGRLHDDQQCQVEWSPPPPVLAACAESRCDMQRFYTKAFLRPFPYSQTPPKYCWVNFDVDTIHLVDHQLEGFSHIPSIRQLVLETRGGGHFERGYSRPFLRADLSLEKLTILDLGAAPPESWWFSWISYMELFYFGCDAVSFDTTIVHDGLELTRDTWLSVDRAWRRKMIQQIFGEYLDHRESDDGVLAAEDDPRMSMCRRTWRHVEWCTCPNKPARSE
ncbi:uncharacterized protein B0H64DRAFT_410362 [Chaetomium fimeti]|uniref:2EXR domain-containing protein n=1 Tax=Chaetomium fimeti TaxID=1854472 RepID=A0AAE0H7N3_9PEZI|nr:hypothetical protein B0H64DRAFT_410362 [Chaetomium fimeti]